MDLRSHRFFNHFPDAQGDRLEQLAKVKRYRDRAVIFEEGSRSDSLYLVVEGRVALTKRAPGGYIHVLAHKNADDFFGELGVLDGSGRSTSASAAGPVTLARIEKNAFLEVLSHSPWRTVVRLFNQVSENLRTTNERFMAEVVRKEKITLIGEMANGMIHDFKNPFTTIRLAVDMINNTHADPRTQEMCRVVLRQIHRLGTMVEEVLEFAKGDMQMNRQPVRLEGLFQSLATNLQDPLGHTRTKLLLRPTPLVVPLDFDRMMRVLQNLVGNALEAIGPDKRGKVTVSALKRARHVEIQIEDNGPGVPTEIRDTLFEPFVSHGKRGGTGLGLAIAKSITEAHGGQISYRSKPRGGTTFALRLPLTV